MSTESNAKRSYLHISLFCLNKEDERLNYIIFYLHVGVEKQKFYFENALLDLGHSSNVHPSTRMDITNWWMNQIRYDLQLHFFFFQEL